MPGPPDGLARPIMTAARPFRFGVNLLDIRLTIVYCDPVPPHEDSSTAAKWSASTVG